MLPRHCSLLLRHWSFRAALGAATLLSPTALLADAASAAAKLGGEYSPATGKVVVKKNQGLDLAALSEIAADPKVSSLTLDGCKGFNADALATLAKSKTLKSLDLTHTMVNKVPDLQALARIQTLESLNLGGSDFGDDGLAALSALKNMQNLNLGHVGRSAKTAYTANGLKVLASMPKLEALTLHIQSYSPDMGAALANIKTLKTLSVGGVTKAQFDGLKTALPKVDVKPRGKLLDA